jgi:hypothetical protein
MALHDRSFAQTPRSAARGPIPAIFSGFGLGTPPSSATDPHHHERDLTETHFNRCGAPGTTLGFQIAHETSDPTVQRFARRAEDDASKYRPPPQMGLVPVKG